jgi:hypothetical protein
MIALESLTTGTVEESYEINNTLLVFHAFALGAVVYYVEAGVNIAMLIPLITVVATDIGSIVHVAIHIPKTIQWAWNLVIFIPSFGLFLDVFAIVWVVYVVYVKKIVFKHKKSAGAAASTARRINKANV